ncbi:unnamed protein product [Orchesella dallaii]|uniref:Uncharacterized protein n=1 Tax=Orchesella dallaii TaxID=48710 RepID=A0ABP1RU59_9HEXA
MSFLCLDDSLWIFVLGIVQVITILIMSIGFWILFARDQRLVRAIESIPAQIQQLYRHQNHQFNQLRPVQENAVFSDDDDDEAEIHRRNMNPFLQQSPAPITSAAPSSSQHQEIEMEQERNDDDNEYSSSEDDEPEVLPQAGIISKFGRIIRRPNFFRY